MRKPWPQGSACSDGTAPYRRRVGACGATVFPRQDHCPRCSRGDTSNVTLPETGMLVAWTTQGFLPGYPYKGTETPDRFHRRHGAPALVFSRTKGPISVRGTATLVA